jgi:hypothetical protein
MRLIAQGHPDIAEDKRRETKWIFNSGAVAISPARSGIGEAAAFALHAAAPVGRRFACFRFDDLQLGRFLLGDLAGLCDFCGFRCVSAGGERSGRQSAEQEAEGQAVQAEECDHLKFDSRVVEARILQAFGARP